MADREWCGATTAAGNPCRSNASIDGLCATHYWQARRREERASAEPEGSQDSPRCGGTNKDGRPCRHPQWAPGYLCWQHRHQPGSGWPDPKEAVPEEPKLIDTSERLFDEDCGWTEELASLEREGLQEIARLMFTWAARPPAGNAVGARSSPMGRSRLCAA